MARKNKLGPLSRLKYFGLFPLINDSAIMSVFLELVLDTRDDLHTPILLMRFPNGAASYHEESATMQSETFAFPNKVDD